MPVSSREAGAGHLGYHFGYRHVGYHLSYHLSYHLGYHLGYYLGYHPCAGSWRESNARGRAGATTNGTLSDCGRL